MKDDDDANDVSEMRKKVKSGTQKPNVPCDPNRKKANFALSFSRLDSF